MLLISDLFYDPDEIFSGLDHLRFLGHDVLVFHILDPLEHRLPVEGQIRFHDLETGEELSTHVDDIRSAYQSAVGSWSAELDQGARSRGIDLVSLTTDMPLDLGLDGLPDPAIDDVLT